MWPSMRTLGSVPSELRLPTGQRGAEALGQIAAAEAAGSPEVVERPELIVGLVHRDASEERLESRDGEWRPRGDLAGELFSRPR